MVFNHGGNFKKWLTQAGCPENVWLDFSASINPFGPPECLRRIISRAIDSLIHYPDPDAEELVQAIGQRYSLQPDQIIIGNGSTEILFALARAFHPRRALIPVPAYSDYAAAAQLAKLEIQTLPLPADNNFSLSWPCLEEHLQELDLVFLGQPNNPTGLCLDTAMVRAFAQKYTSTLFVMDEAFVDFVAGHESLVKNLAPNIIVLRSLTKFFAIPGLRLGFAAASPCWAQAIKQQLPPWSVNTLAQAVGVAMLKDDDYINQTQAKVTAARQALVQELSPWPDLFIYPSQANYLLIRLERQDINAPTLAAALLQLGIAIRVCDNFPGLDARFFRVAVKSKTENQKLCEALSAILHPRTKKSIPSAKAKTLMIQGTSSNAGKSILTAALGRILLQDGVRVAPFKAQNMSLNSFVTSAGGEMSRAQVVQAQACRLEPDVRMNPILLKPTSDLICQVMVQGKPLSHMNVAEYFAYQAQAFAIAKQCFDSLAAEHDVIILEGAGSPGEVNLKQHDIVNMPMARYAQAPVLIVGDIDRGGVFASFVGTFEVLSRQERAMIAGWVVNRFRGDEQWLGPALDYTFQHTGKPVLGVIPYLPDLNLPEEDAVEFRCQSQRPSPNSPRPIEIAIIDLPHISNFTDIDPLEMEEDVLIRIIHSQQDLNQPDAIIIPGSKNTMGDLAYLKNSGIAQRITALATENQTEVIGICAGFQMLGQKISDPQAMETSQRQAEGLGLLKVHTVLWPEKILMRTTAKHMLSGLEVSGYEIHHGQTNIPDTLSAFTRRDGQSIGAATADHQIWGTYLHGVFDTDLFRHWFIDRLRLKRGLAPRNSVPSHYNIEPALDRLAQVVRQSLAMDKIYALLGLA